ncbi:hypothetical protein EVAR_95956_1 [Eumeta japonica]|uniref:Uncharacterized protein n=1 Tax=Eumeta variegata TaxID=151549 RepID=A0A4C1V8Z2_EUMVA|nr:hypothetical protein EVAR_95956_1 [Eumeta japonica]
MVYKIKVAIGLKLKWRAGLTTTTGMKLQTRVVTGSGCGLVGIRIDIGITSGIGRWPGRKRNCDWKYKRDQDVAWLESELILESQAGSGDGLVRIRTEIRTYMKPDWNRSLSQDQDQD